MAADPPPLLVVFLGGMGGSPVEDLLSAAIRATALDSLEEALGTGAFSGAILATDVPDQLSVPPGRSRLPAGVAVDPDHGPFHFGRRLAGIIEQHRPESVVYFGAGSVPLFRGPDFAAIASGLAAAPRVVISNNFYSGDLIAFRPASALLEVEPPAADNALPRLLRDRAGLENQPLPRNTATQFNIDSPADLAILKLAGGAGTRLSRFVAQLDLDVKPYCRLLGHLVDPTAEVLLAGRVGSQVWSYLERETACRLRVFSEERGMQAAGRDASGEARSLLAFHLREVGCRRFFSELAELAGAACVDTRPILSHLGVRASRADRFWSDLARPEQIEEPFLREFTQAAREASIPVLLGGHSLVSGGLMLLTEHAWREDDQRRQS